MLILTFKDGEVVTMDATSDVMEIEILGYDNALFVYDGYRNGFCFRELTLTRID